MYDAVIVGTASPYESDVLEAVIVSGAFVIVNERAGLSLHPTQVRHMRVPALDLRRGNLLVDDVAVRTGERLLQGVIDLRLADERTRSLRGSLRDLVNNQYSRNDLEISRGRFRVRGDVLEIGPAYEDKVARRALRVQDRGGEQRRDDKDDASQRTA